ncbi:MAG: polymer-forming cytoskeletal protein [Planctomycetota bacterium]
MADGTGETTVVGADSHFKGELMFEKTAKIIGKFDGKITGKGELQVVNNATCQADVEAATANIDGTIEGNVTANDTVRLNANGVVKGDITAAKMVMAEGASFYGMCAVGPDAKKGGGAPQGGPSGDGNKPVGQPSDKK